MKFAGLFLVMWSTVAGVASADPVLGTWRTEIDRKRTYGHVQIAPCGAGYCGTVVSAFTETGQETTTPNVGRRVLHDLKQSGPGYAGRVFVPLMNAEYPVQVAVRGTQMDLKACNTLGICRSQRWKRVN